MTIPYERTLAILRTRDLLMELAYGTNQRDRKTLQAYAKSLLKHYPDGYHLTVSANRVPGVWGDPDGGYLGRDLGARSGDDTELEREVRDRLGSLPKAVKINLDEL